MIDSADPAITAVATALVSLVVASLLLAFLYPAFRRVIKNASPANRSLVVLCYALIAPVTGIVVTMLSVHPEMSHFLVPEHCHRGVCGSHVPALDLHSIGGFSLAALGPGLALFALLILGNALLAGRRRLRTLLGLAQHESDRAYHLLESDEVVAWCCGLVRSKIVISRGLESRLNPAQLGVVLAHEAAHAARLDNLRALLLRWATVLWPTSRQRVRTDLRDDCENACDAAALAATGDRRVFAETLATLARFRSGNEPSNAVAFGGKEQRLRLAKLCVNPGARQGAARAWLALCVVWLVQILVTTGTSHYLVEWVGF